MEGHKSIFVVSDSTGETAERVVRAALLQFPEQRVRVRVFPRVRDEAAVVTILDRAVTSEALVVFTVVATDLRAMMHQLASERNLEAVDVIGSLIHKVGTFLEDQPINVPSNVMPLSEEYFRRVEAIEFAVKSDDGKEPRNFKRADLVLVGVSRTSKTPLSTYLAGRGLRVANIPLVLGVEPPPELFDINPERVVGLTLDVDKLLEIRRQRLAQLGMPEDSNYGIRQHVVEELEYAEELYKRQGWATIDVSGRAIEETATIVLELYKDREERKGSSHTHPPPHVL